MKTNNLKKRKNNMLIATIITVFCLMLNTLLFLLVRLINVSLIVKIILISILLVYGIFILPKLLVKLHTVIYNYLCKNIDIIENHLSDDYTPIFLNKDYLKSQGIVLRSLSKYFAKLEDDGKITIIKITDSDTLFTEQTSDYSLFLYLFCFEE